jgi:hypothetical protein
MNKIIVNAGMPTKGTKRIRKLKMKLLLPSKCSREPILFHAARDYNVSLNIESGRFARQNAWVILLAEGTEKNMALLLNYFKEKEVVIDSLQHLQA